jgi:hypothetical protein
MTLLDELKQPHHQKAANEKAAQKLRDQQIRKRCDAVRDSMFNEFSMAIVDAATEVFDLSGSHQPSDYDSVGRPSPGAQSCQFILCFAGHVPITVSYQRGIGEPANKNQFKLSSNSWPPSDYDSRFTYQTFTTSDALYVHGTAYQFPISELDRNMGLQLVAAEKEFKRVRDLWDSKTDPRTNTQCAEHLADPSRAHANWLADQIFGAQPQPQVDQYDIRVTVTSRSLLSANERLNHINWPHGTRLETIQKVL